MHREAWRRWMRTIIGKDWNEGGRWSQKKEISKECKKNSQASKVFEDLGFQSSPWITRRGSTKVDWGTAFPVHQGWTIGVMPGISVRHFAAPLSRTGKTMQNPARQPRPDPDAPPEPEKPERRINRAIVSRTIRLITHEGHKILTRQEALRYSESMDLDLVEVDGKQDPPVCKLMDFNKERFKEKRREKELKKKQSERRRLDDLKEVRFSTRTEQRDLELKSQMALRLLTRGHRVKLSVVPHGNDELEPKGRELLERMVALLQEDAKVETGPRVEKQRAWVLIRPTNIAARGSSSKKQQRASVERAGDSSVADASDSEDDRAS